MTKWQVSFLLCMFIATFAIWYFGYYRLKRALKDKRFKEIEEDRLKSEAEQRRIKAEEPRWAGVLKMYLTENAINDFEMVQLRTRSGSPHEAMLDAWQFYVSVVDKYAQGYKLFMGKPTPEGVEDGGTVVWAALDRIQVQTEKN